jgi:transposase
MNSRKYVFAQISSFLPQRIFDGIVARYKGGQHVRHFTCWNQLMCMMYVIAEARKICLADDTALFSFSNSVYAFDSTIIDLHLGVFCWATFRTTKAAIKLHAQYDIRTAIPVFVHIPAGPVHDTHAMDEITYEPGSFYIFDRGYIDFERLFVIHESKSFFVIRAKTNLQFKRQYSATVDKSTGLRCDQTGELKGFYTFKQYPERIRRIKFYDEERNRTFVFLTNNLYLSPEEIAALYKHRWKIEFFFKWIKQHLKIKSFWGTVFKVVISSLVISPSTIHYNALVF